MPGWVEAIMASTGTKSSLGRHPEQFYDRGFAEKYVCPGGGTVYAEDLKSLTLTGLWVRIPPRAQNKIPLVGVFYFRVGFEREGGRGNGSFLV